MAALTQKQQEYAEALARYLRERGVPSTQYESTYDTPKAPSTTDQLSAMAQNYAIKKAAQKGVSALFPSATGATEATQAAWNAPAMAGEASLPSFLTGGSEAATSTLASSAAPEATTLSNFAGSATPYLGGAGAALGAYGAYKGIKGKDPLTAGLGGAGMGAGLGAMGLALGPVGWAAMIGAPLVAALANKWGDRDRFKDEYNRALKLREQGINWNFNMDEPTRGRSREELAQIARDTGGNEKFAMSRDEGETTGNDWVGYSFLPEKFGNTYAQAPLDKQIAAAQMLVDANAIREHHGTADFNQNFNPELEAKIKAYLEAQNA